MKVKPAYCRELQKSKSKQTKTPKKKGGKAKKERKTVTNILEVIFLLISGGFLGINSLQVNFLGK